MTFAYQYKTDEGVRMYTIDVPDHLDPGIIWQDHWHRPDLDLSVFVGTRIFHLNVPAPSKISLVKE